MRGHRSVGGDLSLNFPLFMAKQHRALVPSLSGHLPLLEQGGGGGGGAVFCCGCAWVDGHRQIMAKPQRASD